MVRQNISLAVDSDSIGQSLEKRPGCIQAALAIIGDKWTALVLRDLSEGAKTFSELEHSIVGISPRTLSQRLDKLNSQAIVTKNNYCLHPPRFEYAITPKGLALQDVLIKMAEWGDKYSLDIIDPSKSTTV